MQHLYSLRQMRAPTAASEENPLPLPSLAKSRRFISNNIGHAIRKTTGGVFSPELAKKLARLIAMEKNLLRSMENASKERMDNAQSLSAWGDEQDDDISDVTDKLSVLLYEVGDLEDQYVDRYDQYRLALKEIRNIEKVVQPIRDRKQKISDNIAKLQMQDPASAEIEPLQQELVRVEAEAVVAEAQLSNITHEKIKSAFDYQFEAMREYGEKLAIIAGYGKHLMELVETSPITPGQTRPAYNSHDASTAIVKDCDRALTTWVGSSAAVSTELSARAQSMLQQGGTSGELAGDRPALSRRRWSSDSEDANEVAVTKQPQVLAA